MYSDNQNLLKYKGEFFFKIIICHPLFTDLPRDEQLDDLMRLSTLDSSNFKEDEIGSDLIKDQQKINMEFDSGQCAVLPEDRAQKLLVSVSIFFQMRTILFNHHIVSSTRT